MEKLLCKVEEMKKDDIRKVIDNRISEFKELGRKTTQEIFKELCFCLLTANYDAEKAIRIQKEIGNGFLTLSEQQLAEKLKELGYRFPNKRAQFIAEARQHKDSLKRIINGFEYENELRGWFANNIKGIGYKEASHFLRNIGFENFAIIDFHILDILSEHGMIEKPKTLNAKNYIEIETVLKDLGKKLSLNMAELDLYLWYCETGKVMK